MSLLVPEWAVTNQEPAILPVLAQCPLFEFKWNTAVKRSLSLIPQPFQVVGVKESFAQILSAQVLGCEAAIVERRLVCVEHGSARVENPESLGDRIGNSAKLLPSVPDFSSRCFERPFGNPGVAMRVLF
jgi:hypothetical protein